jgi:transcriptional regulator with XRE-family HTH domain
MNDIRKNFIPKKLQQIRLASRMTQSKLAKALNVSRSCLANYETGKRSPDNEIIKAIANFYNVEANYFTKEEMAIFSTKNIDKITDNVLREMITTGKLSLQNISLASRIALYEYYNYLLEESYVPKENIS